MEKQLVPTREADFLEQDPPLRGQNYVCLSFISPEDILKKKELYFMEKFLESFSKDMNEFFTRLAEKYTEEVDMLNTIKDRYSYVFDGQRIQNEFQYFTSTNGSELESTFHEQNDFQTSIRGLKIRGTFDTLKEAEIRAQVLKRIDDKFHVYIAQVGCWCPWSPNPDEIADQEYAETHLNTLMKSYKENQAKKDVFFEERKRELQFMKTKEKLEDKDPWTKKAEAEVVNEVVPDKVVVPEEVSNEVSTEAVTDNAVVPEEVSNVVVPEETVKDE